MPAAWRAWGWSELLRPDLVHRLLAGDETLNVSHALLAHAAQALLRVGGDVRAHENLGVVEVRVVGRRRLVVHDVDRQGLDGAVRERIETFGKGLDTLLNATRSDCVYWIARCGGQRQEGLVTLSVAPLDVSAQLRSLLYGKRETIVFSSATLRIGGSFDHLRRRLGLNDLTDRTVSEFVAESPFDYPEQCCVAVPDFLPEVEDPQYTLELSRMMYSLFTTAKGRSLALFTSYEMMRACAEQLQPFLRDKGIRLLTQDTAPRDAITEALRANGEPTVLFGTQSFWEGVDVAGDALSCVVIARLPFESYGDPLFRARCDRIKNRGGVPFYELALPQAVIRFRQGFGRLIRSRTDRGIVVVADARVTRKSYGTVFARSLPCPVEVIATRRALSARLGALVNPRD